MDLIEQLKAQLETKKELIEILEEYLESFDIDKGHLATNCEYVNGLTSLSLFEIFKKTFDEYKDDVDKDFFNEAKKHYSQIVKFRIKELLTEGGVNVDFLLAGKHDSQIRNISSYNESVKINQQISIYNDAVRVTQSEDFPIRSIDKWIDDVVLIDENLRELIDISYYGGF